MKRRWEKYVKPGKRISVKEFEDWLDGIDTNNDGVMSRREIEEAFKSLGMKFSSWKTKQAMASADVNDNGVIDSDLEMKEIIEFAQKHWGLTIYQDEEQKNDGWIRALETNKEGMDVTNPFMFHSNKTIKTCSKRMIVFHFDPQKCVV